MFDLTSAGFVTSSITTKGYTRTQMVWTFHAIYCAQVRADMRPLQTKRLMRAEKINKKNAIVVDSGSDSKLHLGPWAIGPNQLPFELGGDHNHVKRP